MVHGHIFIFLCKLSAIQVWLVPKRQSSTESLFRTVQWGHHLRDVSVLHSLSHISQCGESLIYGRHCSINNNIKWLRLGVSLYDWVAGVVSLPADLIFSSSSLFKTWVQHVFLWIHLTAVHRGVKSRIMEKLCQLDIINHCWSYSTKQWVCFVHGADFCWGGFLIHRAPAVFFSLCPWHHYIC